MPSSPLRLGGVPLRFFISRIYLTGEAMTISTVLRPGRRREVMSNSAATWQFSEEAIASPLMSTVARVSS